MTPSALTENLKLTSGDDLVTKLTSCLVPQKHVTSNAHSSGSSEMEESHLASTAPVVNDVEGVKNHAEDAANSVFKAIPRRRLKRSVSDLAFSNNSQHEPKTAIVTLNAFRSKDDMYHSQHAVPSLPHTSPQPYRTPGAQPDSKPRDDPKSGEPKFAKSFPSFRHNPRAGRPHRRSTGTRPGSSSYTALRSSSDSDLTRAFTDPKLYGRDPPSKSCIKKRAKSDTSMPPNKLQRCTTETGSKALPRIKTVSFGKNSRSGHEHSHLPTPEVASISKSSIDALTHDDNTHPSRVKKPRSMARNSLLFPNPICAVKSGVADPAITRADVHMIAISPTRDVRDIVNGEGADPATPTMQTIETRSGSYEVVWDDIPSKQSIRARGRRGSSASHSLAKHGLGRIDSKLAYWSGTWHSTSDSLKPTNVVFPDDDDQARSFECTIEDQEDIPSPVPPNSQVTSVTSSRHASRPTSRSLTRTASSEDMLPGVSVNGRHWHAAQDLPQPSEEFLFMLRPEVQHKERRNKYPAMVRQLSSLEEADSHFYGHRDSVSIAHERLTCSKRAPPKPFAHQDSYIIAKQRMNNRAEDMLAESASSSSNDLSTETDDVVPEVLLPVVKEHAVQALKNSSPVSILQSPQHLTDQQHVRIVM